MSNDPQLELAKKIANKFAIEMKNDRHDGYVKNGYRDMLVELKDHIERLLSK